MKTENEYLSLQSMVATHLYHSLYSLVHEVLSFTT